MDTNKTYRRRMISYDQFGELVGRLAEKIKNCGKKFQYVYGIDRGGIPIAIHLSHHLNLTYYSPRNFEGILPPNIDSLLIVDDLVDTGSTMISVKNKWNKATTAVLFFKPHAQEGSEPDIYLYQTEDWIDFPWERSDQIPNRDRYAHLAVGG